MKQGRRQEPCNTYSTLRLPAVVLLRSAIRKGEQHPSSGHVTPRAEQSPCQKRSGMNAADVGEVCKLSPRWRRRFACAFPVKFKGNCKLHPSKTRSLLQTASTIKQQNIA